MQIIEQMLGKKVSFHSINQVCIITMLIEYSVNEARKSKYDVNETSSWLELLSPDAKEKQLLVNKPHMLASSIFMRPSSVFKSIAGH